jgi:hypothetical protein
MLTLQPPTTRYRNIVFDSARWAGFDLRPGDIVISTPPKCGTTWTQMLCALLVFDGPEFPAPLEQLSPWMDMLNRPVEDVHAVLEAQGHRRIIKTHTPLDGVPFDPAVDYVVVGRDPRDVAVSWEHHMANLDLGRMLELRAQAVDPGDDWFPPLPAVPDDPADRFRWFVTSDDEGSMNLAVVLQHLDVAWQRRHLSNVHLVHYSDLRRDLPGELLRLGQALGFDLTDERASALAAEATLERMRERVAEVAPSASQGLWHDTAKFIRTGGSGEWREWMTDEDERTYRQRVDALVEPDLARWVHESAVRNSTVRVHAGDDRPTTGAADPVAIGKTRFEPTQIASDTFLVHDHQGEGTEPVSVALNSMVIRGAQPVVVDTGMAENREQYLADVFSLVEPEDIRWVFISHDDVDHTGNLNALMAAAPNATLVIDWFMQERMGASLEVPASRWRWVRDGDRLDVGDRVLQIVRPPVFDSGTTRGLFDPSTGVYWGSDAFASPMPTPVRNVSELELVPWIEGIHTFAQYISPWLELVDDAKFQRTVDRVEALGPQVMAGCHTPAITGGDVADAIAATRTAPTASVPPQPDQSVLDAIQSVLEPA